MVVEGGKAVLGGARWSLKVKGPGGEGGENGEWRVKVPAERGGEEVVEGGDVLDGATGRRGLGRWQWRVMGERTGRGSNGGVLNVVTITRGKGAGRRWLHLSEEKRECGRGSGGGQGSIDPGRGGHRALPTLHTLLPPSSLPPTSHSPFPFI